MNREALGIQSTLAIFEPKKVESGEERVEYIEYRPIGQINNKSVIEFNVYGSGNRYIDLRRTRLTVEIRIVRSDGTPIKMDEDNVALVNLAHSTIFRQCDVLMQHVNINPDVGINYAYKAYIDTVLNCSEDAKESHLSGEFFFKDTAHAMKSNDPKDGANVGLYTRSLFTNQGQTIQLSGPLHSDVFKINRYLLNGVPINIRLNPALDTFSLVSPDKKNYQLQILDAKLKICHVHVNPDVVIMHNHGLEQSPAIYPFNKSEIKAYSVASGMTSFMASDMFQGRIPTRVVVGLTPEKGYSGSFEHNPFYFPHMNCNYMAFHINGVSRPDTPFTPDFKTGKCVESFLSISRGMGIGRDDSGNFIDIRDYPVAYAFHVFDIHSTQNKNIHVKQNRGQTLLDIRFDTPLPEPTTVIVYASFSSSIEIDQARNVQLV